MTFLRNPPEVYTCPDTRKTIRRVTTEYLLSRDPTRHGCANGMVVRSGYRSRIGGRAGAVEAKRRRLIQQVEDELKKRGGACRMSELLDAIGVTTETFNRAMRTCSTRIRRERSGSRGNTVTLVLSDQQ